MKTLLCSNTVVFTKFAYTSLFEVYVWRVSDSRESQRVGTRVYKDSKVYTGMRKTSHKNANRFRCEMTC